VRSNITLSFFLLVFLPLTYAQHNSGVISTGFFVTGSDTVFCSDIFYVANSKGKLKRLDYTVTEATSLAYRTSSVGKVLSDNSKVRLRGHKHIPDVSTFQYNRPSSDTALIYDKVPKNADEPLGETQYVRRRVDGKLKLYIEHNSYIGFSGSTGTNYVQTSSFCYILKLADGTFVNVDNKENMKNIVIPYLKKCEAFTKAYKGDFNIGEEGFTAMIELYNSLCAD